MAQSPTCSNGLVHPFSQKYVGISGSAIVAIRGKDEVFAVERKHGEAVEDIVESHLFQAGPVGVDRKNVELPSTLGMVVAGEKDFLAIGVHVGCPVGSAEVGHLAQVGAIKVADEDLQVSRLNETLGEQLLVGSLFFGGLWAASSKDKALAVGGEECAAVVAQFVRHLPELSAVGVHHPQFEVARADAGEDYLFAVGRYGGFCVVARRVGKLVQDVTVQVGHENVELFMDRPDVFTFKTPGSCQAGIGSEVSAGIHDLLVARHEIRAGRFAFARADQFRALAVSACKWHVKNLIAGRAPFVVGSLKDEVLVVKAEVRLCIVAPESELPKAFEMLFLRVF